MRNARLLAVGCRRPAAGFIYPSVAYGDSSPHQGAPRRGQIEHHIYIHRK